MTNVLATDQATLVQSKLAALTEGLGRVLLGKEQQIGLFAAAILGGGHILLIDSPGVGKTTLAKGFAACAGGSFARVQGTSDLLPTDLTGVSIYDQQTSDWQFHPGPLSHHVVLIDELNRIPARTQSALLESLAENQVTVDGVSYPTPSPFSVVATANPGSGVGTFPVVDGLLDRFTISMSIGLPTREAEKAVALGRVTPPTQQPQVIGLQDLEALRLIVNSVTVVDAIAEYCLDIVDAVRQQVWLSPRASQGLIQTAKGRALLAGRDHVTPDDIQALCPFVLGHRFGGSAADKVIEQQQEVAAIAAGVQVPAPGR